MPTLLLRLAGPMQSWGTQSRFSIRDTGLEPSKSGVLGLLCAALGKPRDEGPNDGFPTIEELAALRMGVRVDLPGVRKRDFHTAGGTHRHDDTYGVIKADGKSRGTVTSHRWYLSDAFFLVGLSSDDKNLLGRLDSALAHPRWQLSLGRKAYVPGWPVRLPNALRESELVDCLKDHPLSTEVSSRSGDRLLIVVDATPESATEVRQDVPVSFSLRKFTIRYVMTDYVARPEGGE